MQAQLSISSFPDFIFSASNRGIVEGSVMWLFCEVNSVSSTLSVSWNKDGGCLIQDVPHIILRTSTTSSSTTLILVLDNVVSTDAGLYQCTAHDGLSTANGSALTMTGIKNIVIFDRVLYYNTYLAVVESSTGTLRLVSGSTFFANRTTATIGDHVSFTYTVGHVGDDINYYYSPLCAWFKDGALIGPITAVYGSRGQVTYTLSFTFDEPDAGVYQCIFFGSTGREMYGTIPVRLDTGIIEKRLLL